MSDLAAQVRNKAALRIDKALDKAARQGILKTGVRFCMGDGNVFCTLSENPARWGHVSVLERHLMTFQMGHRYMWTLDFPRSLMRVLAREPSNPALEIFQALDEQLQIADARPGYKHPRR